MEIKLTTGDAADAMEKVSLVKRIWRLRVNRKPCPAQCVFDAGESGSSVDCPRAALPVRNQVSVEKPDWSTVPFIMAIRGRYAAALNCGFDAIKSVTDDLRHGWRA